MTFVQPIDRRPCFACPSVHLDYAIYELLKNAMRAVVEHHWSASSLPAVNVHIAGSPEQITLRFSDQVIILRSVWRQHQTILSFVTEQPHIFQWFTGRRYSSRPT